MVKSTKILSLIMTFILLVLVGSMVFLTCCGEKEAFADTTTTVNCYLDADISLSTGLPIADSAKAFSTGLNIRFVEEDSSRDKYLATGTAGVYTVQNLKQSDYYIDSYLIQYSLDGQNWTTYDDSDFVWQIKEGWDVNLYFFTLTFEDSDHTEIKKVVTHYNSLTSAPQAQDVVGETGDVLFKEWQCGSEIVTKKGSVTANKTKTYTAIRVPINPNKFTINIDNTVTVYSLEEGIAEGTITYGSSSEAINAIVTTYGNTTDTDMTITLSTNVNVQEPCVLGQGKYTVTGDFVSTAHGGAFQLSDTNTQLTLKDAQISTGTNTNGVMLDQGTLILDGQVDTGGLVLTKVEDLTDRTLTIKAGSTTEAKINLYYQETPTDNGNVLNKTDDAGTLLLTVSGEDAANFVLKNDNNACGMKYDPQTGVLQISQKFALTYQKTTANGEQGTAPSTEYIIEGEYATFSDADLLTKRGHDFVKWQDVNDANKYYQVSDQLAMTQDVTVQAVWTPIVYTVVLQGTTEPNVTHTYGTATVIPSPSNVGFIFDYWTLGDAKKTPVDGKITLGAEEFDSSTARTITLFAHWYLAKPTDLACDDYQAQYDGQWHALTPTLTHPLSTAEILYQWSKDGTVLGVESRDPDLYVKDVADSGEYVCTVRACAINPDGSGWVYSDRVQIKSTVTITRILLGITSDNVEKRQGDQDPPLTFRITSGAMAQGETLADLGASLMREEGEEEGEYPIRFIYTNPNYQVLYTQGYLTITADNLLIIILPSVLGGLTLIGGVVALTIILIKKKKKALTITSAVQSTTEATPTAEEPRLTTEQPNVDPSTPTGQDGADQ